jgi:hypothetical protein
LFEVSDLKPANTQKTTQQTNRKSNEIHSQADLEQALVKTLTDLTSTQSSKSYIALEILGTQFSKCYGQSVSNVMKQLKLTGTFSKFLQSCSAFKLQQVDKKWQVAIAKF